MHGHVARGFFDPHASMTETYFNFDTVAEECSMTNLILRKEGRWFPADYRYPVACEVEHYWLREAFENYMKMLTGPYERAKVPDWEPESNKPKKHKKGKRESAKAKQRLVSK